MTFWILYANRAEKPMNRGQRDWTRKGLNAKFNATKSDAASMPTAYCHAISGQDGA